jgi:hypothetical protein
MMPFCKSTNVLERFFSEFVEYQFSFVAQPAGRPILQKAPSFLFLSFACLKLKPETSRPNLFPVAAF